MEINGVKYNIREIDFNTMCELEDTGVSITEISKKPFSVIRGFLAVTLGVDSVKMGQELTAHIEKGGSLDALASEVTKIIEKSGFFKALNR